LLLKLMINPGTPTSLNLRGYGKNRGLQEEVRRNMISEVDQTKGNEWHVTVRYRGHGPASSMSGSLPLDRGTLEGEFLTRHGGMLVVARTPSIKGERVKGGRREDGGSETRKSHLPSFLSSGTGGGFLTIHLLEGGARRDNPRGWGGVGWGGGGGGAPRRGNRGKS